MINQVYNIPNVWVREDNKTQWDKLINFFRREMEFRAMEIEKELETQINHSLDNIYSKINYYAIKKRRQ